MKFGVLVREEDGRFWAEVPALPGCFTQGDTHEELVTNVREAIEGHLAAMAANGIPLPSATHAARVVEVEIDLPVPAGK